MIDSTTDERLSHEALEGMIDLHEIGSYLGLHFHRLWLKNGRAVVGESYIGSYVAEWNSMCRLMCLIENNRL